MIPTTDGWVPMGREWETEGQGRAGRERKRMEETREITGFWSQVNTGVQGFEFGFLRSIHSAKH